MIDLKAYLEATQALLDRLEAAEQVVELSREIRYWGDPNESACKEFDIAIADYDAVRGLRRL